jgi:MFS family permease
MKWLYSKKHLSHKTLVLALYIATIFFSLHYAITLYLGSLFLGQYINENFVGLVFVLIAFLTIYVTFELSHFLNKYSNYRMAITAGIVELFVLLGLAFVTNPIIAIILFIIQQLLISIILLSLNISLTEVSKRNESGSIRGVYFTILSLGVLTAAFFSGVVFQIASFSGIYLVSALLLIPVIYIIYRFVHNIEEPHYKDISFIESAHKMSRNKDLSNIWKVQFTLESFYVAMIIYMTPYLSEIIGIPTSTVLQVIMPIALLPFIIFPYELGILADTKIGEKELIQVGLLIAAVSTLLIPFIQTTNLFVWAVILFMTRVGASFVESMSSTYFFKKIHKDEAGMVTLFTNGARCVALVCMSIAATILTGVFGLPTYTIFIVAGLVLLIGLRYAARLHDTL